MARAAIFDVDGTLVDSVDLHAQAWRQAFARFGKELRFDDVRSQIGKGGDQLMPVFLSPGELARIGDELDGYRSDLWKREFLPRVQPFPGARPLFLRIRATGTPIALASSAKADELATYERLAQIQDLIAARTSSDDAARSKPHPDIFEAALRRLGMAADRRGVVVIGDSPYDMEAGARAHLGCIGVLSGGFPETGLRAAGAREIYADLRDLLARFDASALAGGGVRDAT